ncbi:hypothetical protein [uncultured Pontibacter sp.]|uniref:hypothetical protein n=1 Tax=uncultured Pontibacter sp. TaxID=453356 RepID=UPI002609CBA0|nr:hypothetical protein [uncultured Pontibacter sp.]
MKTSNKLLLGLFAFILLSITALLVTVDQYVVDKTRIEAPAPPAAPEPPQVPGN